MEKLINELITEVKNLSNSVKNLEEKLEILEKEIIIKSDNKVYTVDCSGRDTIEHSKLAIASDCFNLNTKYLFENMVIGGNNELAYKSALKVAQNPGHDMKLLYIYGDVGLGKTHLLNSISNYIIENNKSLNVTYITINNFTNELIDSISNNSKDLFNRKFYNSDVLIFDDMQNINGKERTQEEFKDIVNTALDKGKQVVLGSSKPSYEIVINGEKFESVFEINAAFQLKKLDVNTRIRILKEMVGKEHGLRIDDDSINIIAENTDTNVRELIGAYNKLISYTKIKGLTP